jgi:hypothetical protein
MFEVWLIFAGTVILWSVLKFIHIAIVLLIRHIRQTGETRTWF